MKRMRRYIPLLWLLCMMMSFNTLSAKTKILFIPLDDRPSSWQFPQKMALIADAEVIIPPKELLGHFFTAGNSDKIIQWIETQNLNEYDAAIVSLDMLAYGGLVGSRAFNVPGKKALGRVEILERMRKSAPDLKIYAQNVVMRLALTGSNENSSYYGNFTEWAKISGETDGASKARAKALEKEIPKKVVADYKAARKRNLATNLLAVEMVKKGVIDYLILSQDDASPKGIHVADRERLRAEIAKQGLTAKAAIQPGADEVAMLLLARALNEKHHQKTKVKAIYSSLEKSEQVMPFEDQILKNTVSYHIAATGAEEVDIEAEADVLFFVFASRHEAGRAKSFAANIEKSIHSGNRVIVADIDPVGDVQGGDEAFSMELQRRRLFPELSGYASWNTAGNTIGTALPHGVIFTLAEQQLMNQPERAKRIWTAQNWFTLHRVMDDFYFHNLIRKKSNALAKRDGISSYIMTDEASSKIEAFALENMLAAFDTFTKEYFNRESSMLQRGVSCYKTADFTFSLPWNRTFEAKIDFDIACSTAAQ